MLDCSRVLAGFDSVLFEIIYPHLVLGACAYHISRRSLAILFLVTARFCMSLANSVISVPFCSVG
uniref:Uncharacterized protein n=1 Tax=Arundo donax TaxID=35708 RepID=A0A0A8ZV57_ARUDO